MNQVQGKPVRLVAEIDTSGEESLSISFSSLSKDGVTAPEKLMASTIIQNMSAIRGFPQIESLSTGDNPPKKLH